MKKRAIGHPPIGRPDRRVRPKMPGWYDVHEAAAYTGLRVSTIRAYMARGRFLRLHAMGHGRPNLISQEGLDAYLDYRRRLEGRNEK